MNWIKDNLAVLGIVAAFCVGYVEYRVKENTEDALGTVAFVKPSELQALSREIDANAERIANNKEAGDKLDSKIERIVDILLEP